MFVQRLDASSDKSSPSPPLHSATDSDGGSRKRSRPDAKVSVDDVMIFACGQTDLESQLVPMAPGMQAMSCLAMTAPIVRVTLVGVLLLSEQV